VSKFAPAGNAMGAVMTRIADDMVEQMADVPEEMLGVYLKYIAGMMYWVSEGKPMEDMPLPPDFGAGE
jgi:hypothetical protein